MMSSSTNTESDAVIACDPKALTTKEFTRWTEIGPQVYGAVQEVRELPDGYALRLPSEPGMLLLVAEDLEMERRCCPFVRYTLELEPNLGAFWLRFTGATEVKAFLRMALEGNSLLDEQVARAAGLGVVDRTPLDTVEGILEMADKVNERFANAATTHHDERH